MSEARTVREDAEADRPAGRLDLLFVNQHYAPDVASTGQHLTDLAEFLAERGHRVRILTAQSRYTTGMVDAPPRELRNGVEVHRLRSTSFGRGTNLGRVVDYASFYAQLIGWLVAGPRYHGVVLLTTPPLLSALGPLAKALRRQRYAIWSMDLHPDAEIASGMLREDSFVARVLASLNDTGYRGADFVVDLGAYMKRRVLGKGVAPHRARTVEVWSREEEIVPIPRDENPLRGALGLDQKFIVMYSGNAGVVHEFEAILEAMRRLRNERRIHFLFVGDGPRRAMIEGFMARHALPNASYRSYFERDQLRYSLPLADAHLISLRAPFVGIAVPGKLYGIMAAQRPAVFLGPERCESADAIVESRSGVVIDPAAPDAAERLVAVLERWCNDPSEAAAMGARGRAAFLARFERVANCERFEGIIEEYWSPRRSVGAQEDSDRALSPALTGSARR